MTTKKGQILKRRKTLRPNGSIEIETRFYIYPSLRKLLVDGEVKTYSYWRGCVHHGSESFYANFVEKKHAELWIKDMKLNYKNVIMGTNYLKQYEELTEKATTCLMNTNFMFEKPMTGYYSYDIDVDAYIECQMLGVCNGVLFTRIPEHGTEREINVNDIFEEMEHRSVFRLCDEVSKH
jgi:hypothetical protein